MVAELPGPTIGVATWQPMFWWRRVLSKPKLWAGAELHQRSFTCEIMRSAALAASLEGRALDQRMNTKK
eukprot:929598-Amphidinium_carterae.1